MARTNTTTATFAEYAPFFAASPATAISVVHGDTFAVVTRDGHVIPCADEAESAHVMELLTRPGAVKADADTFRCTCGRTVRIDSPSNGYDKCPWCGTFTRLLRYYELVRPCDPHRYSHPRGSSTWISPLTSGRQVPRFHAKA